MQSAICLKIVFQFWSCFCYKHIHLCLKNHTSSSSSLANLDLLSFDVFGKGNAVLTVPSSSESDSNTCVNVANSSGSGVFLQTAAAKTMFPHMVCLPTHFFCAVFASKTLFHLHELSQNNHKLGQVAFHLCSC